jgi:hypothetical protein
MTLSKQQQTAIVQEEEDREYYNYLSIRKAQLHLTRRECFSSSRTGSQA